MGDHGDEHRLAPFPRAIETSFAMPAVIYMFVIIDRGASFEPVETH
jgi:hypothetical protein